MKTKKRPEVGHVGVRQKTLDDLNRYIEKQPIRLPIVDCVTQAVIEWLDRRKDKE